MNYLQNNLISRYYSSLSETGQVLFLCTGFSLGLQFFRMFYTGQWLFAFLVWNLFLAWIPLLISSKLELQQPKSKLRFAIVFLCWLVFVPNSFYIITDLFHLDMNESVPLWYDLALLLSFAWNGLLLGIVSIRQMQKLLENLLNRKLGMFFLLPVMALNGLGIYVGRYLRFNSWDIITNPLQLAQDIIYLFIHPLRNRFDWSMIICYTLLLTLIYLAIKKLGRSLA